MNSPQDTGQFGSASGQIVTTNDGALTNAAWAPPAPMWLDNPPGEEGIDFSDLLHCLRRKWLPGLLIGSVLAAIVAALLFFLIPVSFEAMSLVRVKRTEPYLIQKTISSDQEYMAYKQTQATLLTSPFVLTAALRDTSITQLSIVKREENPLDWLTNELKVFYPGEGEIMQVAMSGDRAEELKKTIDAVVDAYLYEIAQAEKTEKSRQLNTLRNQRRLNEAAIKERSEIIDRLSREIGSSDTEMARLRSLIEQDNLRQISRQKASMQEELAKLASDAMSLQVVQQGNKFYKPDPKDIELLMERDREYIEAKLQLGSIQNALVMTQQASRSPNGMGPNNPYQAEMMLAQQTLQRRRAELTPLLEHQLRKEYTGDENGNATTMQVLRQQIGIKQKQIAALDEEYKGQLERVTNLSGFSADLVARRADLQSLHESNHDLAKEVSRLEVELKGEDRIQRVQPATIPNEGSYLLKLIEVVGGSFFTLLGTMAAIALWDYKAKRLNTAKDVENSVRLPVIGTIPSLRSGFAGLFGGRSTSDGVISDSIDSIRAAIVYGAPGVDVRSVLITSAVGHEGKSTVASQLAVSLARSGKRTLLVDADIRNPQQHAVFGLPLDRGLCDVVRGQANLEEAIQATPAEGLWILPAGRADVSVMQAISGPAFAQMMDRVEDQFDFVILDSGPVLTGPIAMICGQQCDAAVLSTRRDVSRIPKVEEANRRLQAVGIHVIGSVVNGTSPEVRSNQLAVAALTDG